MNNEPRKIDGGTLAGGLILIALGALFLLERFTDLDFGDVVHSYWPMILVLIGVPKLFRPRTVWSGLWLIAIGVWLQIAHLRLFGVTFRNSWPLLLIALGAGMILRALVEAGMRREERP